jgi:ribonuclease HII
MLKTRFTGDTKIEAGVDEVGRGCLWGPLVSGAVVWLPEEEWTEEIRELAPQIKDSKKLSEKRRTKLAAEIHGAALDVGIGRVEAEEIDAIGMTRANQLAFERAVQSLTVEPERLLIDGILPLNSWTDEQHTIIEGDAQYVPIAAASIVAKVYRDTWVTEWCADNTATAETYGLASSKGYGTARHRGAVVDHGILKEHRRLFLRKIVGEHVYKVPERPTRQINQYLIHDE